MNGLPKLVKYAGIAALVSGTAYGMYQLGLDHQEKIPYVPYPKAVASAWMACAGSYLAGYYNGYYYCRRRVDERNERGLRP